MIDFPGFGRRVVHRFEPGLVLAGWVLFMYPERSQPSWPMLGSFHGLYREYRQEQDEHGLLCGSGCSDPQQQVVSSD